MKREKFIKLLSKSLSGEIDAKDNELLEKITRENEEYRLLSSKLTAYFKDQQNLEQNPAQLSRIWEMIDRTQNENSKERFDYSPKKTSLIENFTWLKVAAVFLILTCASLLGYHFFGKETLQGFDQVATTDEKAFKLLDDGTKIWLNKHSSIRYNTAFGQHKREIILEGEAYFDVVKNKYVPLVVHAGNIDIEVKGTAFNVNAQKNNTNHIEVALVRGLIQVSDRLNEKNSILLHPNQKLVFNTIAQVKESEFLVKSINSLALLNETKWIADTLVFKKEKLKDLAVRMEKKYDLKIEIHSEALKEKRFSGTFINETIQQALASLKLSYPLTYTINNRLVIIKEQE